MKNLFTLLLCMQLPLLGISAGPSFNFTTTQVSCNGGSNGTITVTPTTGTAPYTFSNDGGQTYQTSAVFTGLISKSYTLLVKDATGGVSAPKTANVTQPNPIAFTPQLTDPKCFGAASGRIYFVPSGGVSPFTFSINGGVTWQASNNFAGLTAGSYSLQIRDSRGCLSTVSQVTLAQPLRLTVTAQPTDVTCFKARNGTITLSGAGGLPPYQYTVDNGQNWQSDPFFSGLAAASTYIVRVRDANNCLSDVRGATVGGPSAVTVQIQKGDPTCGGETDGWISVVPSGGHHSFSISIDSGATYLSQSRFEGLAGGDYYVIARDNSGCTNTAALVTLVNPPALSLALNPVTKANGLNLTCNTANGGGDGSVEAVVTGGRSPFSYLWSSGQTTGTATGMGAGTHTVTVSDANGCKASGSVTLTQPAPMVAVSVPCAGLYKGYPETECQTLTAGIAAGGVAPYTYRWSSGETVSSVKVCPQSSTSYTVTITDSRGCEVTQEFRLVVTDARCGNRNEKVSVCHYPPGNPNNPVQICIAQEAVGAHLSRQYGHYGCHIAPCEIQDPCNYVPVLREISKPVTGAEGNNVEQVSLSQLLFEKAKEGGEARTAEMRPVSVQDILNTGVVRTESDSKGTVIQGQKLETGGLKITVIASGKMNVNQELVIRDNASGKVLVTEKVVPASGKFVYELKGMIKGVSSVQVTLRAGEEILATRIFKM